MSRRRREDPRSISLGAANLLRLRRESLGLTMAALAREAGVSTSGICMWEQGQRCPLPAYRALWETTLTRLERRARAKAAFASIGVGR